MTEEEHIPPISELVEDFQDCRFPRLNAIAAKGVGLYLKCIRRKRVRWDPEREVEK